MRELKFKFWNKLAHRFQAPNKYAIQGDGLYVSYDYDMMAWDDPSSFDNIILVPCQYTGLKDKNGKEIYEGDIVNFNEPRKLAEGVYMASLYVFDFYEGSFTRPHIYNSINGSKFVRREAGALNPVGLTGFKLNPVSRAKLDDNQHFDWTKAEVLGNILSNPELIDL
jgi:uncharacterized phage protein (TIGR01671 family)